MSSSLPLINIIALCLDTAGAVIASISLLPLGKVAKLSKSRSIRRAWRALSFVMVACIVLLIISEIELFHASLSGYDLVVAGIHFLGPIFVLGVGHLSLLTAQDLLRIDQLEVAAQTDPLTGALNRAGLLAAVGSLPSSIGVIIADLDHFKRINDQFGHEAGDYALRYFVERTREALPRGGYLARFGGEEFVVALPAADIATTLDVAERIRAGASKRPVDWPVRPIRMTVSLGVSSALSGRNLALAIARADKALYSAKTAGRDRVRAA